MRVLEAKSVILRQDDLCGEDKGNEEQLTIRCSRSVGPTLVSAFLRDVKVAVYHTCHPVNNGVCLREHGSGKQAKLSLICGPC